MQNYNIKDYSVEFDGAATGCRLQYENMKVGAVIVVTAKVFLAWVRQKQLPSAVTGITQIFGALLAGKPTYV